MHASSPVTACRSNNFCGVKRSIFVVPEIGSKIQTFNGVMGINAQTLQGTVVQQTTHAALQNCRVILMPSLAWTLVSTMRREERERALEFDWKYVRTK
jgi:hypothetical protein